MKAYKRKDLGRSSFGGCGRVLRHSPLKGPRAQLAVAPDGNVVVFVCPMFG